MRFLALFLFCTAMHLSASVHSQNVVFSFNLKNATFEDLMKEIRQHSDYYFIYKDSEVAQVTKLNKRFKSVSIDKVLEECLKGTDLTYSVEDRLIIIKKNQVVAVRDTTAKNKVRLIKGKVVDEITSPVSYNTISVTGMSSGEKIPTSENDLYVNHLNVRKDVTNRWTENNRTGVKYPRIIDTYGERLYYDQIYPTSSTITRATMLENVSFLRVKNMSLSYSLPLDVVSKMGVSSLSFSFILTNLFTITNYSGLDPETPGATYPLARSCSFGLSLGF